MGKQPDKAVAKIHSERGLSVKVAEACGMSKPALYHYYKDKYTLLVQAAEEHMARLEALVKEVQAQRLPPEERLRMLIERFVEEYANAQDSHRVLTEDVKFLEEEDRERVLAAQRRVVAAFSRTVGELRPELKRAALDKPLTMLLFGMINWMFTWLKPEGTLSHQAMAPLVADLFFGGVPAVRLPRS